MLGISPFKLLKKRLAVNKPDTDWFNAVTRVLATLGVRQGNSEEGGHIERPNLDGSGWNIVLPPSYGGKMDHRWKVTVTSETAFDVGPGTIHWNGGLYDYAGDSFAIGQSGYVIAFVEAGYGTVNVVFNPGFPYTTDPMPEGMLQHTIAYITFAGGKITAVQQRAFSDIDDHVKFQSPPDAPEDVSTSAADPGDSTQVARADHVHYINQSELTVGHAGTSGTAEYLQITEGKSTLAHSELSDDWTLDTNADHDARYFKHALASGLPESKDFTTTGEVTGGELHATNGKTGTWAVLDPSTGNQVLLGFVDGILVEVT